jgi:shikimate dehydrogenase
MTRISGTTRVAVVIGDPVEHSRSPAMMNAAFAALGLDAVMVPLRVADRDLVAVVRALAAAGCLGASITLPHKHAVIAACTRLTPAATAIGAVNTVHFTGGEIAGDNTDGAGYVAALAAAHPGVLAGGRRAVLLGGGGAACSVEAALSGAGVAVTVLARRPDAARCTHVVAWTAEALARELAAADLVVDCTPTGLDPAGEPAFVAGLPLDRIPAHAIVSTLVYHREPLLLAKARERGLAVLDGAGMLVHQGARQLATWTGRTAPVDVMAAALARAVRRA